MAKKRKLNSTNPKYWKKDTTENKPIVERKLIANKGKVKVYAVFEKNI